MKKVEVLSSRRVYDGFYKVDELQVRFTRFQGGWSPVLCREQYGRFEKVVAVVIYDPVRLSTLLVEQCRIGPLSYWQDERAWLLEPVAGHADEGESLEAACRRETLEEAGIEIGELEYVTMFFPTPGGGRERLYVFGATADLSQVPELGGHEAEGEDIRLHVLSFEEVAQRLKMGQFNVASTLIGMSWLIFQKWPQLDKEKAADAALRD